MNDSPGRESHGVDPSDPHSTADGHHPEGDDQRLAPENEPAHPSQTPHNKWSSRQPPPAGQPAWGNAPTQPQRDPGWFRPRTEKPAPQPGVIPLRPLSVREILEGAFNTMRAYWRTILGISLTIALLTQLASTISAHSLLDGNSGLEALEDNPDPTAEELSHALNASISAISVDSAVMLIGNVLITALLTVVVGRAVLGRAITAREAWREARAQLPRVLGLTVLLGVILTAVVAICVAPGLALLAAGSEGIGAALTLLGLPAAVGLVIWLWISLCLAAPALVLEKQPVVASLRRSVRLVHGVPGGWRRIFLVQLLALLIVLLAGTVLQIPTSLIAAALTPENAESLSFGVPLDTSWPYLITTGIGAVISSTVTLPITAGVTTLLYMHQRISRESLDLQLAHAAGVPGFQSTNTPHTNHG